MMEIRPVFKIEEDSFGELSGVFTCKLLETSFRDEDKFVLQLLKQTAPFDGDEPESESESLN